MSRIEDKIDEIERFGKELGSIVPISLKEYKQDIKTKAACERYAQKIIEGIIDIAFLTIKSKNLEIPEDDNDAFKVLVDNNILEKRFHKKLKAAKGMRNIIIHGYGDIDDEIVFDAVSKELNTDVKEFIKEVKKCL